MRWISPLSPAIQGLRQDAHGRAHSLAAGFLLVCTIVGAGTAPVAAQRSRSSTKSFEAGALFDRVVTALRRSFHDREYRAEQLPAVAARYRAAAEAADTIGEERGVVHAFLSEIPASHLALYSRKTHSALFAELAGRDQPTLGMQLEQRGGKFFATWIYEGGPADRAGVRRGDRVLAIDGQPTPRSERLGRRSDDAHLPDPPLHALLVEDEDRVRLTLQRTLGAEPIDIEVEAQPYCGWSGTKASARIIERDGKRIGYVHLWFIYISGAARLLERLCEQDFADCDAILVDLRGRGGSAGACEPIARLFAGKKRVWKKPAAALIDAGSRSAKEVIALRLKELRAKDEAPKIQLIGEPTAGAVIPASFRVLGKEDVLMFPSFVLGRFTKEIEGHPVTPDVVAEDSLPYADGADPILEAALRVLSR